MIEKGFVLRNPYNIKMKYKEMLKSTKSKETEINLEEFTIILNFFRKNGTNFADLELILPNLFFN